VATYFSIQDINKKHFELFNGKTPFVHNNTGYLDFIRGLTMITNKLVKYAKTETFKKKKAIGYININIHEVNMQISTY